MFSVVVRGLRNGVDSAWYSAEPIGGHGPPRNVNPRGGRMPYDERFITPMRQELTRLGVEEMRTREEVDQALAEATEPTLLVVNSMCGCAARNARPGVALALAHASKKPAKLTTVF